MGTNHHPAFMNETVLKAFRGFSVAADVRGLRLSTLPDLRPSAADRITVCMNGEPSAASGVSTEQHNIHTASGPQ